MARVRSRMEAALAAGKAYATDEETYPDAADTTPASIPAHGYFLTDSASVSAGLDFADIATRVKGVVHIGQETAGDTRYLDVRSEKLPSGKGEITFSAAAHRGRVRADNQTCVPTHLWRGDISDTPALGKWVGQLTTASTAAGQPAR